MPYIIIAIIALAFLVTYPIQSIIVLAVLIGIIVIIVRKGNNDIVVPQEKPSSGFNNEVPQTREQFLAFSNNQLVHEHYRNIEMIESQYSVLYNLKDYHSLRMEQLIELCKKDIAIADSFVRIHRQYNASIPPDYCTFKRLAIIYERRKEFDKAIEVCVHAIKLGFVSDGSSGGMHGRLARMLRKGGYTESPEEFMNRVPLEKESNNV